MPWKNSTGIQGNMAPLTPPFQVSIFSKHKAYIFATLPNVGCFPMAVLGHVSVSSPLFSSSLPGMGAELIDTASFSSLGGLLVGVFKRGY